MSTTTSIRFALPTVSAFVNGITSSAAILLLAVIYFADPAGAADLKVMNQGLGSGTVASSTPGIDCGADCDETYGSVVSVTLTATPAAGSTFSEWRGDCSGTTPCTVSMSADRSVRAVFDLTPAIPTLSDFTPGGIQTYLTANPAVNAAARFLKALPPGFKQNWILMSRSESLQTGTAELPRILLPSADAQFVFTLGLATHSSYPGAHPNAIEYMQWDGGDKNFRFHEIVLDTIPAIGGIPARTRGVSIDDGKCSKCHSTRNVLNKTAVIGTDGIPPGSVKTKNKPNWDSYDSWGGMMTFNRDRIYQGSVEAAAFRKLLNFWTWRTNGSVRPIIEQLELQPSGVPAAHVITRQSGGTNDGHINFGFDASPPVLVEPAPTSSGTGLETPITTSYSFDGVAGTGAATSVTRGGSFVTLHHSNIPGSDEGRGVRFFDALGGLAGTLNQQRIADELKNHRFATGNVFIDPRPIALAITKSGCLSVDVPTNTVTSTPPLTINFGFFNARNDMTINDVVADTRARAQSLPRRKADIQKLNSDRTGDPYLSAAANGLVQQYGSATSAGTDTATSRLRQEVFRRPIDLGLPDSTVIGGIYVDRELYSANTEKLALYRYFLEPLGVSVDRWSMGVRGRSRTYTFADVFGTYLNVFQPELEASLGSDPIPGLSAPFDCASLIAAVNSTLSSLPLAHAVPTYTDVQRIFNKSCIECHGGLDYPPYNKFGSFLDLSEDENPPAGNDRLDRSHELVTSAYTTNDPTTSFLYQRINDTSENCPFGLMPCGGPALSKVDIETIRRWIVGGRPNTRGDPHITTIEGVNYDFQSAGEYVLLRGQSLQIQARQTAVSTEGPLGPNPHTGLTSCVSVNSAVALRIGSHRITYQPNLSGQPDPDGLQLRVDGKLRQMSAAGIFLASGGRIIRTTVQGGIQIEMPGGAVVVITPGWWNHYQLWYLDIDARHVRATEGVMGAIAPGNWLPALPDGSLMGPRPVDLGQRYRDLYDKFGNAWRVSDATTLFDYAPGASTETFTIESWPNGESPRSCIAPSQPGVAQTPPAAALPLEVAEDHCGAIAADDARANCVQDVMVTGEPGFARTYLAAEQVQLNGIPTAPVLIFPEGFKTDLDTPVAFTWKKSSDLDGDPLTYRHCVWEVRERYSYSDCDVVFDQTGNDIASKAMAELESGKAYYWKVVAEDGKGGTVESETRRFEIK